MSDDLIRDMTSITAHTRRIESRAAVKSLWQCWRQRQSRLLDQQRPSAG
jgi:hypothetical protein